MVLLHRRSTVCQVRNSETETTGHHNVIESVTDSELELPLYLMMRNSLDEDLPEDLDQQYMYCTSKTEQGTPTYSDSHHNNSEINTKIHVHKTCYGRVLSFD